VFAPGKHRTPWLALLFAACAPAGFARGADATFFARRIAPLLEERCVRCHNPRKSRGDLDLTGRGPILKGGDNGPAVVPGDAGKGLLIRLTSGPKPRMPKQGPPLTQEQLIDLRRWIDEGASWPASVKLTVRTGDAGAKDAWWSLRPLTRPPLPAVRSGGWLRTPIDRFIVSRLEEEGLLPSPEADRVTLIRRLTYDLHGLPPMPEEIDAFVSDHRPDAYERLVDRLLASPRYGERWGRHWLDVVHYGDTHGYDKDKRRDNAWPYRDYVIRSFNNDTPYARFIQEQVAGDVLYPGNPDGVIATGFIAAGPWDFVGHVELREGTVDKLKTRLLDRDDMLANAIGTFDSLTVHCARCHSHKFDPIPQKEYYRLQAVFAGVDRGDRPYDEPAVARRRQELERRHAGAVARRAAVLERVGRLRNPEVDRLDAELASLRGRLAALPVPPGAPSPSNGYHSGIEAKPDVVKWVQVDLGRVRPLDEVRLVPARPTDFPDSPGFGFPVRFRVEIADDASFMRSRTVADHTRADFANPRDAVVRIPLSKLPARFVRVTATRLWRRTNDYVFALAEVQVDSAGRNVAAGARVTALDSIEAGRWSPKYLVDGFDSRRRLPDLADPREAARVRERLELGDRLRAAEGRRQAAVDSLLDAGTRAALRAAQAKVASLESQLNELPPPLMVYAVLPHAPRPIHLLHRGNVEGPGELMTPGTLSLLPGLDADFHLVNPDDEGARRAALARWIADRRNVLTWRSIVNRVWHYHFGRGLVDTPNDFGRNGSVPTHAELLDWLAVEFRDGGQSLKQLHRLVCTSAVYRQASANNAAGLRADADNRRLWRMNRRRLEAEAVHDAVLAVSGKLNLEMGGPGFELFRFKDDHSPVYDHSARETLDGPRVWRRAVYRFVVRSVPNPFMESLDCADPNINTPVRNTTITALQALAIFNDTFVLRQSEYLAERLRRARPDVDGQIGLACRLALGRRPKADERRALTDYAQRYGLANACRVILNMNEFIFVD
jgi:hypothetical protein